MFCTELLARFCADTCASNADCCLYSAATNQTTQEGVAIKKVTNVFSKKILAKRALREIKLLQHFRGHRNVRRSYIVFVTVADHGARSHVYTTWISLDQTISMKHISMRVSGRWKHNSFHVLTATRINGV